MKASIVDLRYKMKDILRALDRNEEVTILYHGSVKGIILPRHKSKKISIKEHPFFGMEKDKSLSVDNIMDDLRGNRYNDI